MNFTVGFDDSPVSHKFSDVLIVDGYGIIRKVIAFTNTLAAGGINLNTVGLGSFDGTGNDILVDIARQNNGIAFFLDGIGQGVVDGGNGAVCFCHGSFLDARTFGRSDKLFTEQLIVGIRIISGYNSNLHVLADLMGRNGFGF